MSAPSSTLARSATKSIAIRRPALEVFAYLADLSHWPDWAIVNVKEVRPRPGEDWWDMVTPHGQALLRLRSDPQHGILDHDFRDPQASWTVPARVVPNGAGATVMLTFFQPPDFTDAVFDAQMRLVDVELAKLKEILEAAG